MLFLVLLFLIKNTSVFKNTKIFEQKTNANNGLTYGDMTIVDLVNKDTDGDGIQDWQESLYGLDPNKKETTPGISDSTVLNKLTIQQENDTTNQDGGNSSVETKNLTQTEKFSRELFATVAALNQSGKMDQAAIDALSNSLIEKMQNSAPRKIYTISEIKIINDNSPKAIETYLNTLININKKYPVQLKDVMEILQEFSSDINNPDVSVLKKLDPLIKQEQSGIMEIVKMNVPQSISALHLDCINKSQILLENISDVRLFESDPIISINAIIQFEKNVTALMSSAKNLTDAIKQKLSILNKKLSYSSIML